MRSRFKNKGNYVVPLSRSCLEGDCRRDQGLGRVGEQLSDFIFWAVLTIVTPVLVRLSATAKVNGEFFVIKHPSEIKAGKMVGLLLAEGACRAAAPPLAPKQSGPRPASTRGRRGYDWQYLLSDPSQR
ncbi:hypothetical protein HAX54_037786 [Datura stramonium]|uniref:Uncharacterized protein n=1 Tax=Datura stramonium TaxID=4076 RepID=A0ABS8SHH6_DATST|nr:hypothetical protein [Datura stramonium]